MADTKTVRGDFNQLQNMADTPFVATSASKRGLRTLECCFCKEEYMPTHNTKEEAFASDDLDSREQWLSGCCGPACWDIHMKPPSSQGTTESS